VRSEDAVQAATLRDYLQVVRRRRWLIIQAVVLVPLAAAAFSLHQQKLYQASAQVLLSSQNLAAQLTTGSQSNGVNVTPDWIDQTQAEVARVAKVAEHALAAVPKTGLTPQQFLDSSSVSTATGADVLTFSVTNPNPRRAKRLVDAYAAAYVGYRRRLDTAAIHAALANVDRRIGALEKADQRRTPLYASLVDRQQTLQTMEALQTSNASVIQAADQVVQTQPKTVRNVVLGVVLGLVLGLGLAFLREALDTRVRTAEEISQRLGGLALLGRLPAPDKRLRAAERLAMLEDPRGGDAEAFRMLRTNLDFVTFGRSVRSIMVTSAVEREGKTTTAANLAVALARQGRHVALVDLDLRKPSLARFFDLGGRGLTEVALGYTKLEEALVPVALTSPTAARVREATDPGGRNGHGENGSGNGNGNGNGRARVAGILEVLPSGLVPPNPGEFVNSPELAELLIALRERADLVIVDTPPVLHVSDAVALSSLMDGIVVLTRLGVVRRQTLHELARQLEGVPAPVLGFVVTDAAAETGYGSAYGYGYGYGTPTHEAVGARTES
jgi:succinoglycan biosynthesis transport protein ExoP